MDSEDELIGRLAKGDQAALQSIYERYNSLLYSVAHRITGESGGAEEVLQDTFFQLWTSADRFDPTRGSLIGWLLTIVRHRAISRGRKKGGRFYSEPLCDTVNGSGGVGPNILEQQIARELLSIAFAELSKAQHEAIMLAYFDGMTCEEIAVCTQVPLGTIKSRLRSALKTMRLALNSPRRPVLAEVEKIAATLEDILITEQLLSRPCRERSSRHQTDCLGVLAGVLTASPAKLIDSFLGMAVDLCAAGTAGLSLLETNAKGQQVFRWTNLTGNLRKYVGGTTPRHFSPCGVTLDHNSPQLFSYPGRYFQYFSQVEVPIVEGLVIPFRMGKKTEGTVWIISHDETSKFDAEDVRVMTSLTEFTGGALHLSRTLCLQSNSLPSDGCVAGKTESESA